MTVYMKPQCSVMKAFGRVRASIQVHEVDAQKSQFMITNRLQTSYTHSPYVHNSPASLLYMLGQ